MDLLLLGTSSVYMLTGTVSSAWLFLRYLYFKVSNMDEQGRFLLEAANLLNNEANFINVNNSIACKLWNRSKDLKSGGLEYGIVYIRPPQDSKKRKRYTHRLALMVHFNCSQLPKGLEASHLCHNSLCINPHHITLEPHAINNQRIHCKLFHHCTGHVPYRTCLLDI